MAEPASPLDRVRTIALALPEAEERASHGQPTFFAAGKMFAQFRHDHHGDGRTIVAVKTGDEEDLALIEAAPESYSRVAYFGRGWVGLNLSGEVDWDHVATALREAGSLPRPAACSKRADADRFHGFLRIFCAAPLFFPNLSWERLSSGGQARRATGIV